MKNIISILIIVLFSSHVFAMDMGLGLGYRSNDGKLSAASKALGNSLDGAGGIQLGGILYADLTEKLVLRSGFMYTQRYYELKNSGATTDIELTYVDVPATIMYKIEDYGGAFVGVNLGLNLSDDCGSGDCTDVESLILPFTFGGYFKVAPQVAIEVFYELVSGDLIDGLEDATAVGANVLFTFD